MVVSHPLLHASFEPLVEGGDIHRGLSAQRQARDGEAGGVHFRQRNDVIEATERVPGALAHEGPVGVLQVVLADVGRDDHIAPVNQRAAIPVEAGAVHDLLAAAAVAMQGEHSADLALGLRGAGQPDVRPTVRQRLQGEFFEHGSGWRAPQWCGEPLRPAGRVPVGLRP